MSTFPPEELDCPDPAACPVVDHAHLPGWSTIDYSFTTQPWFRAYNGTWGYDEYNPGYGDARFSPFDDTSATRIGSLYIAQSEVAALLETVFRTADAGLGGIGGLSGTTMDRRELRKWLLVAMSTDKKAVLADFRDPALSVMGISRAELTSSPAEHYPCTRRVAKAVHADPRRVDGIVWHSRQAEVTGHGQVEAVVLFADRFPSSRGLWERRNAGSRNLYEGPGWTLSKRIARRVGIKLI